MVSSLIFSRVNIWTFHFWTFIFVHFQKIKKTFPQKKRNFILYSKYPFFCIIFDFPLHCCSILYGFCLIDCHHFCNISNYFILFFQVIISTTSTRFNYYFIILIRIERRGFVTVRICFSKFGKQTHIFSGYSFNSLS